MRLLIFVVLICGTAHTNHAHAGAIRKALVGTGIVTGVAVGSAIVSEEIGAAVVAALIAAKIGIDTDAYSNAITDLKMVLALHRIVGKHLANKALNNEVRKDPSLAELANQVRADAGLKQQQHHDNEAQAHIRGIDATPYGPDSDMPPPGDCDPDEYKILKDTVAKYCKTDRQHGVKSRCEKGMTPVNLYYLLDKYRNCALAREEIMNRCFQGGNTGHRTEAKNVWNATQNCADLLRRLP